jgi:acyl-CoA thioester hydrolase
MSDAFQEVIKVRFRDTDAQGHMFFANYLVFADEVAGNYMRTLGFDWSNPESLPTYVFTANASCDYIHECVSGDEILVEVAYTRLGNTSATLGFTLTRVSDNQALAKGSFAQVFVDPGTRRPTPVPDALRRVIEKQLES